MIGWTGLNLYQVMEMNIIEFFNLTLFNMDWNDFQEKQQKKQQKQLLKKIRLNLPRDSWLMV